MANSKALSALRATRHHNWFCAIEVLKEPHPFAPLRKIGFGSGTERGSQHRAQFVEVEQGLVDVEDQELLSSHGARIITTRPLSQVAESRQMRRSTQCTGHSRTVMLATPLNPLNERVAETRDLVRTIQSD